MNPTEALLARFVNESYLLDGSNDLGAILTMNARHFGVLSAHARSLQSDLDAARQEIAIADELLKERNRVLAAIPECEAHGDQCVPHALEWIASVQKEIADLREAGELLDFAQSKRATLYASESHWVFVDETQKERRGIIGSTLRDTLRRALAKG